MADDTYGQLLDSIGFPAVKGIAIRSVEVVLDQADRPIR